MKGYFHGSLQRYPYFEGWYLKHQSDDISIAFIPAFHCDETGQWKASLQIITEDGTWQKAYRIQECKIAKKCFYVKMGKNIFSQYGVGIDVTLENLTIKGYVRYGPFNKLKSDIMGPFRFLPFLQCNHGVLSMGHSLSGYLRVNGKLRMLKGGVGYIESDWGTSFPSDYLWTQTPLPGDRDSIMVSVAHIPFGKRSFQGCICAICYGEKEYRMATYRGVRIEKYEEAEVLLIQGNLRLHVKRLSQNGHELQAPREGDMKRVIKESLLCKVRYQFWENKNLVFDIISDRASFEQELPSV